MPDSANIGPNFEKGLIVGASTGLRTDGPVALWADKTTHRLLVDAGSITTSSATAGTTGAAVPASADYIGVNSGGNLVGLTLGQATMDNSIPVAIASNQGNVPVTLGDGTNTANILKSDGTAAGQNAQLIAAGYLSVAFTTTSAQAVGSTDAANYRWVSVHINTQGTSSSVVFQGSNDNVSWVNIALASATATSSQYALNSGAAGVIFHGPLAYRYFRLNVTGISAGTTAGTIIFSAMPAGNNTQGVAAAQAGTWTVQPGNTVNTSPWAMNMTQIGGATLALGQNTMANSIPVTLASNQTNINVVSPTGLSDKQASVASFTITLASLASVATPPNVAGRQSTLIDNTTNLYIGAKVYLKIKMGTTPTANTLIYVYLIQYDNSAVADDGAGTTDAALTVVNATLLGTMLNPSTTTGQLVYGVFDTTKIVDSLGPKWGIAIVNTSGVALDSTEGNHTKNWIGIKRQIN